MDDVTSSTNDPLFILHHTMVDCMLDEWLELHPDAEYPNDIPITVPSTGHQPDDFLVPFFPLTTNTDVFTRSHNFGYFCDLPNINSHVTNSERPLYATKTLLVIGSLIYSMAALI